MSTNFNNIFNPIDYTSTPSSYVLSGGVDINDYVRKDGSIMSGTLTVPRIKFADGSHQDTANGGTDEQLTLNVADNTTKLENVTRENQYTRITGLKLNDIQFANGLQSQPFTDIDKNQIYINQGNITANMTEINTNMTEINTYMLDISLNNSKLENVTTDTNNIIVNGKTLNIENSPTTTVENTLSINNYFDPALSFLRSGIYKKWWLGSVGDNTTSQNTFNICVDGNTNPESVFELDSNGNLKIKGTITSSGSNTCCTDIEKAQIYDNSDNIAYIKQNIVTASPTSISFNNEVRVDNAGHIGNVNNGLYISNSSADVTKPITINTGSSHLQVWGKTLYIGNTNGGRIVMNGEVQNHAFTDKDHDVVNTIVNGTVYEIISGDKNMFIDSGVGDIQLHCSKLFVGNGIGQTIILNNETQNHAFTDAIKTDVSQNKADIATINSSGSVPIGTILMTAQDLLSTPPTGFLFCDGQSVSLHIYSALYAILGHTYQNTKPLLSGYFYVPDMRQLYVRGSGQNETYPVDPNVLPTSTGLYQGQSVMEHTHGYEKANSRKTTGFNNVNQVEVWDDVTSSVKTTGVYDMNDNKLLPMFAETRPETISMNYMIKY